MVGKYYGFDNQKFKTASKIVDELRIANEMTKEEEDDVRLFMKLIVMFLVILCPTTEML